MIPYVGGIWDCTLKNTSVKIEASKINFDKFNTIKRSVKTFQYDYTKDSGVLFVFDKSRRRASPCCCVVIYNFIILQISDIICVDSNSDLYLL